jgi:hypothetical protein
MPLEQKDRQLLLEGWGDPEARISRAYRSGDLGGGVYQMNGRWYPYLTFQATGLESFETMEQAMAWVEEATLQACPGSVDAPQTARA